MAASRFRWARNARESSSSLESDEDLKIEVEPLLPSPDADQAVRVDTSLPISKFSRDSASKGSILRYRLRRITCRQSCLARFPKGKASLLIFILNVIETFAFYGTADGILRLILGDDASKSWGYAVNVGILYCAGRIFYPLAGFIADTYLGRFRVIRFSLWLLWIAFALLALTLSLNDLSHGSHVATRFIIPIITFVFVSLGSAGFEATIIPFGADQLSQGASSDEMSSYFYWYYFARQLGVFLGLSVFFALYLPDYPRADSFNALQPLVALLLMTIAIILVECLEDWLFKDRQRENPLKSVVNVLYYAATVKRHLPIYRRAFRYGEAWQPRIELAKIKYDGMYRSEAVEDVKTFCRILLVIFSLGGYFLSYSAAFAMMSYRANTELSKIYPGSYRINNYLFTNVFALCNITTILLLLPIMNHLILPCFPLSSIRRRLGFGVFLNFLSIASAAALHFVLDTIGTGPMHRLYWFLIPTTLLSIAEMLVFVSGLEFIYAQSPENMKGLLTGLFYFAFGVFAAGGVLTFNRYPKPEDLVGIDCILWYYFIFAVIGTFGFVVYAIVSCLYTNRQRPIQLEAEEEDCI